MKKKILAVPFFGILALLLVFAALIAVGTVYDLRISEAFVRLGNPFGMAFALIGKYPAYALLGASGILFFLSRRGKKGAFGQAVSFLLLFGLPLIAGALYGYDDIHESLSSAALSCLLGIAGLAPAEIGLYFLFRNAEGKEAFNAGMAFFFSFVIVLALCFLLKSAASRPRYLFLVSMEGGTRYYQPWYSFNNAVREAFPDENPSSFASWPSAHAALASLAVLTALFPRLNGKLKGKGAYFFLIGEIWALLVALARLSDGSHFLSDVSWGALIGTGIGTLVAYLIYGRGFERKEGKPLRKTKRVKAKRRGEKEGGAFEIDL
ncbi:MAG: phosphatase PAP2 family protein [Bacilli bacterium]|jgi:membrane-associated phospholipid phosphatase|nr:phosphatase PAP2 family protein [Bacilli bacterium]